MSTHTKSRRRPGRGPRRDRERQDTRPTTTSTSTARAPQAPAKLSLWDRIKAFFSPKKASSNGSTRPATRESRHPAYTPAAAAPAPKPTRKPEAIEVTSPKLYVGNLSFDATENDIAELFKGLGSVQTAEIVSHKVTEKSKGFGFVVMATVEEAKRAVETLHDKEFMGRKLVVSGAKTNDRS
jgi:RNA recognition motif-containing protein